MSVAPFEIMQEEGGMGKTINVSHTHKLMHAHTHALGLAKKLKNRQLKIIAPNTSPQPNILQRDCDLILLLDDLAGQTQPLWRRHNLLTSVPHPNSTIALQWPVQEQPENCD